MSRTKNRINVSEIFSSIQGEGPTMGKPSIFCRLQACNLSCGLNSLKGLKDKTQEEIETEQAENAKWVCDTTSVWLKGERWETEELANYLFKKYAKEFLNGAQLILTGGEPFLQQKQFPLLIGTLQSLLAKNIRLEIETNGTIKPLEKVNKLIDQYNVSPKLANSGMPKKRRIKKDSLNFLSSSPKSIFKFVVFDKNDIYEVLTDFMEPFMIPHQKVWLMPACSNIKQYNETAPIIADLCKEYGFQFSSRLQINLWNQTTGV